MMAMRKTKWILITLISLILIQSAAATSAINPSSSSSNWTTFRGDLNHSGYTVSGNPSNSAKPLWNYTTGAEVVSSPSVADGYLIVGGKDNNIYSLNASNGQLLWNFTTADEVDSAPAISDGYVYVSSYDGWVYSLDIATGTPVWVSFVGGKVLSSPAVANGLVYVGSGKQGVFCFNASNGKLVWIFPTSLRVDSSPAISDGVVYVATDDFSVHALNASTGTELWKHHTGSVISSPSVYNGYVYVGSYDGFVCGLNASTGNQIWQFQTQDAVDSSPAVAYGIVYVGSEDNNVYALNASNGVKIWQAPTGYWVRSSPAIAGGNVYVGSEDYSIYCFNASTGAKKWSYATSNIVDSSPAIANGILYIGSSDHHIYAFTLTESAPENTPQTSSIAWTTIAFDAIAVAAAAMILFTFLRFIHSNRRDKRTAQSTVILSDKSSWISAHFDAIAVLAILAFSTIFFINLGSGSLWAADEQTYSQWAYHMVRSGDYLTPYAFGGLAVWIGKPPLPMWFMSLAYQLFGVNNFVTRLSSAVFGVLTLVLVYFLAKKLYNRYVGFASALVLGTFNTFYLFARHAMTDVFFVFFIVASFYFFVLSEKNEKLNRYVILSGLFFGLALMTKQVEALLIPLIIFSYLLVTKRSIRFLIQKALYGFLGSWTSCSFALFSVYVSEFWVEFLVLVCGVLRLSANSQPA